MKILTVIGARPQFIKAAMVSQAIAAKAGLHEVIVHTGQHFDANMSDVFFSELGIAKPTHSLQIHSLSHGAMTGRMLEAIETVLLAEKPDWVLVYGDTNSTLAGALAAVKLHIKVAHVEAGLRSFNRAMPEEINRIATDHVSDMLFAPTTDACEHLANEGISSEKVALTGDVMYDCVLRFGQIAESTSQILSTLGIVPGNYVLTTAHRAENTSSPDLLRTLFDAMGELGADLPVVMPVHPRTRTIAASHGIDITANGAIRTTDPLSYLDMVRLEQAASLIVTDSGGVQKEAYFHRVPCLTLREQTEWVELVAAKWNVLCPLQRGPDAIVAAARRQIGSSGDDTELYGDGKAAARMVARLTSTKGR